MNGWNKKRQMMCYLEKDDKTMGLVSLLPTYGCGPLPEGPLYAQYEVNEGPEKENIL